jgi:hypothetical protein
VQADRGTDFIVRSPDDRIVLAVEAKRRSNASAEWAAQMRRNLSAHGMVPDAPYFLLALPDKFFLWKDAPALQAVPPDFEFDATDALRPYLDLLHYPVDELSAASFESIVRLWLEDLVRENGSGRSSWLRASGLDKQLRNAVVTAPLAA